MIIAVTGQRFGGQYYKKGKKKVLRIGREKTIVIFFFACNIYLKKKLPDESLVVMNSLNLFDDINTQILIVFLSTTKIRQYKILFVIATAIIVPRN